MQYTRTSPTLSPQAAQLPQQPAFLEYKCTGPECSFSTNVYAEAYNHHASTGHPFDVLAAGGTPIECRCGRAAELRPAYICGGCNQPIEACEDCTRTAITRPQGLISEPAAPPSGTATPPEEPPPATLGAELDGLAALLDQVKDTAKRAIADGATHLGPCFTASGLEHTLETLLGSAALHSKHLTNKRRELRENRALYVDQLRDRAQKARNNGDTADAHWLAGLADNLSKQLADEGVRHG